MAAQEPASLLTPVDVLALCRLRNSVIARRSLQTFWARVHAPPRFSLGGGPLTLEMIQKINCKLEDPGRSLGAAV